ncbi:MAG TPA: hypothetical protein VOA87_06175 [Thermoanaerobaculia bacterium]|nr:hypothetical protein [Thermoanaerobaculia bacterium]
MKSVGPLLLAAVVSLAPASRSTEVFRLDCANDFGRREVTLFANGTVRLREGPPGKERVGLAELGPDELGGALRRLQGEDLSEIRQLSHGVEGPWIERCDLALALAGKPLRRFHFGRYDTLPLPFSRVLKVVDDVAGQVKELEGAEHLPPGYAPRPGDVLKRTDGQLFEIVADTADKRGVEMRGIDQPLTLYVLRDQLGREFVALTSRKRP